ncbi:magnesium transporter [Kamptonema cortianum]|nr:magnesium transporter [Kamptonema cortianum]
MDGKYHFLQATDGAGEAVSLFQKTGRSALPVVDSHDELIGIVTIDDILDVAQEKSTEDMQRMGGTEALEDSYLDTGVWEMVRKRGLWLVILFLGGMLTATAMGRFEEQIEKAVVLAIFVPLIISSGGNSGSQAATLIIRAMSTGEVTIRDWWRILRREILAGLLLGAMLGVLGLGRVFFGAQFADYYGDHVFLIGLTIAFSLVGVVLWGTLMGSMLPLLLKKAGQDPAVSSTPFVATLVDVTGILIYFSIALFFLSGKMF